MQVNYPRLFKAVCWPGVELHQIIRETCESYSGMPVSLGKGPVFGIS